jgi:hypothetical protein
MISDSLPRVIVHDKAQSLVNARDDATSKGVPHTLCHWHENRCVSAWLQKKGHGFGEIYPNDGQRVHPEGVNNAPTEVSYPSVESKTEDDFDEQLQTLYDSSRAHSCVFYRYLVDTWFISVSTPGEFVSHCFLNLEEALRLYEPTRLLGFRTIARLRNVNTTHQAGTGSTGSPRVQSNFEDGFQRPT